MLVFYLTRPSSGDGHKDHDKINRRHPDSTTIDRPKLAPEDGKKLMAATRNNKTSE
jgi:hypothetical protein